MVTLHKTNVDLAKEFEKGSFVISRTRNLFSSMGIDQCHEQLNKIFKGDGGAIGLTEDEAKLQKWSVCGPEIGRMVREFEDMSVLSKNYAKTYRHHEETTGFQNRFIHHCKSLVGEFEMLGNPFLTDENEKELIQVDTRDIMSDEIVKVFEIEKDGKA